ncbi:MAG: DNA-binding protein [Planctomycetes bacterium]|nr:DNA-binding protein [Planctomycetota bacterium]
MAKAETAKKGPTKSEIYANIAAATDLSKKQVASVLDGLNSEIAKCAKKGITFTLPGLAKIVVTRKPATKAGMKPNPFKPGEMMEVKARPARNVVKIRPLKALKDMVGK